MPKLYFSGKDINPPTGGQVHVKYSYAAIFKSNQDLKDNLSGAIDEGRLALNDTITHMQTQGLSGVNSDFKFYASKYFLTDQAGPNADEFHTIYSVLALTQAGVNNAGLSVKVYNKKGSARGYVTTYSGFMSNRDHRTPGMYNSGGASTPGYRGDIHMSVGGIKSDSLIAAKLFVHEATHKFANTADFGQDGYTDDITGSFRGTGLTKTQALMNADSYGRFAVHFYRSLHNMPQW